jgi:hypothetical protein
VGLSGFSGIHWDSRVELRLSRLNGTAKHPDMQKIRIIGFFSENRLHWRFEFWLLLFTVCGVRCGAVGFDTDIYTRI